MRLSLFVAVTLMAAGAAAAEVRLITRVLPNGATLVLAPDVPSKVVAMHVTFDAGSRHDVDTRSGTAWLASRIVGARLGFEADLNQERSVFTAEVPAERLQQTLEQTASALHNTTVTDEELTRIKEEVLEESRRNGRMPGAAAGELLLQLAYGRHAHSRASHVDPSRVRRRDVEAFLQKYYGPGSVVIALAGSFDAASVASTVDAAAAKWPAGGRRMRCQPYRLELPRERRRELSSPLAKYEEIHIGYPTAVAPDRDWYALNILADIIGQGPKSRLQRALVGRGLAVDFGEGMTESPCTASLLRMRVRISPGVSVADVISAMDEELRRLMRAGVSDAEVLAAREQERQWSDEQLGTAAGVAGAAARTALFYGDAGRLNRDVDRMNAVSRADVQRVAQAYLQPTNRAMVVVRRSAARPESGAGR